MTPDATIQAVLRRVCARQDGVLLPFAMMGSCETVCAIKGDVMRSGIDGGG